MLKKETKTIGEHTYEVTQLDAVRGRSVFLRFAKLIAPGAGDVVENTGEETNTRIVKALAKIVQNVSEEDLNVFCDVFSQSTCLQVTGDDGRMRAPKLKETFNLHFAGNYDEMIQWLYFCFEVNFGNFFAKAGLRRATPAPAKTE